MTNSEQPLVSVLTPVYNGEAYIRECIESVLAQTYTNWEYIVVNNCSSDRTLEIAREYTNHPRVRVETNPAFLPIIANHNRAFSLISPHSKYCKIVSADDWIFPECLTRMVDLAEAHPSIGIIGAYQLSGGSDEWYVRNYGLPYAKTVVAGREICRAQLLGQLDVFGNPTSSFYRADLVRRTDTFFPNETAEADRSALYPALSDTDYGFIHQVLTYERLHDNRITTVSHQYMAYISANISDCVTYGKFFLSSQEQETRIQALLDSYYAYLAYSVYQFRDKAFWDYHAKRMGQIGYPLKHSRLIRAASANILNLVLNPSSLLRRYGNG